MRTTLNSVMDDWKKFAEDSKKASEQERLAGKSIPGGERNSSREVPAGDPLVKDTEVAPAANRENTPGSECACPAPGVEVIQPTEGSGVAVADKPLVDPSPSLDKQAEASRVADLANAIVAGIYKHNASVKQAEEAKNKDAKVPAAKTEGPTVKESKPVVATATSSTAPALIPEAAASDKAANVLNMELTTDVLAKIAAIVCSTEDGAAFVQAKLDAAIGPDKTAIVNGYMDKQAEIYNYQMAQAQAEYDAGVKYAEALINDPMFKLGQQMGMESLGMAPEGLPPAGPEGMPPAGPEGMPPEGGLPPEAMAEPGMPGGDEDITPEDIIAALQEMVSSGEIDEATATQLVSEIMGAGGEAGGAPAEGGAPEGAAPAPGGSPVPETPAKEEAPTAGHEASESPEKEKKEEEEAGEEGEAKEKEAALKVFSAMFKKAQASRK